MAHWWHNTEGEKPNYWRKSCASATFPSQTSHALDLESTRYFIVTDQYGTIRRYRLLITHRVVKMYGGMQVLTYLLIYLLSYLLSPWSRILLKKLTGFKLVKKFPAFYGTRRFITSFTRAHYLSLSHASSIQSIAQYPTS
jgi:hypothetical protein